MTLAQRRRALMATKEKPKVLLFENVALSAHNERSNITVDGDTMKFVSTGGASWSAYVQTTGARANFPTFGSLNGHKLMLEAYVSETNIGSGSLLLSLSLCNNTSSIGTGNTRKRWKDFNLKSLGLKKLEFTFNSNLFSGGTDTIKDNDLIYWKLFFYAGSGSTATIDYVRIYDLGEV